MEQAYLLLEVVATLDLENRFVSSTGINYTLGKVFPGYLRRDTAWASPRMFSRPQPKYVSIMCVRVCVNTSRRQSHSSNHMDMDNWYQP